MRLSDEALRLFEDGRLGAAEALGALRPGPCDRGGTAPGGGGQWLEPIRELDSLVGLAEVKALVREVCALVETRRRRQRVGLAAEPVVLHMVFTGNPGTGKTTVARILGRVLRDAGALQKGHLIEVERADLVGEYIGHTAQRTREQVRRALGGILFIDEAYSLARGGEKDFGKEAIDCLVKAMEDHRENLVLILAGYRDEMERFLWTNPGLRSRFPIHIAFPDYTVEELMEIAGVMLAARQYTLAPGGRDALAARLRRLIALEPVPSNARLARNVVERAIRRQALRVVDREIFDRSDLMVITADDIEEGASLEGLCHYRETQRR